MNVPFEPVDPIEAISHMVTELAQMTEQLEVKKILFFVRSGVSIRLFRRDSQPLRSILVRSYNGATLGYTAQFASFEAALDRRLEVLRDENNRLLLREDGLLFTPSELARRLVDLVADHLDAVLDADLAAELDAQQADSSARFA